jgi:putative membrane protein
MQLWGAGAALLLASSFPALAQDAMSKKFITEAVQGNLAEVKMGQLAETKGQSDGVKQFGKMLENDHSTANEQATAVATQLGVNAPTEPNAKQKKTYDMMSKLSGTKFDQEFASHMVADHKTDIAKYNKAAKGNGPAADYAKQTLPTLNNHLQTAQSLNKQSVSSR